VNTYNNKNQLRQAIEGIAVQLGSELIEYRLSSQGKNKVVRCLVDYPKGGITIDTCAAINKKIIAYLDTSNILGEDFIVEISSPGLDRPLKSMNDFLKVSGKTICFWLKDPLKETVYLEAKVEKVEDNCLLAEYKEQSIKIDFDNIRTAKEKIKI